MGAADFKINAAVRRVLTQHWISMKKVRYSCIGGIVYVRGFIELMYNAPSRSGEGKSLTGEQIGELERAIKRIPNVKRVNFQLNDWEKKGDGWTRKIHH